MFQSLWPLILNKLKSPPSGITLGNLPSLLSHVNNFQFDMSVPSDAPNAIAFVTNKDANKDGKIDSIHFVVPTIERLLKQSGVKLDSSLDLEGENLLKILAFFGEVLAHEIGHIKDYNPNVSHGESPFPGGESRAEQSAHEISQQIKAANKKNFNIGNNMKKCLSKNHAQLIKEADKSEIPYGYKLVDQRKKAFEKAAVEFKSTYNSGLFGNEPLPQLPQTNKAVELVSSILNLKSSDEDRFSAGRQLKYLGFVNDGKAQRDFDLNVATLNAYSRQYQNAVSDFEKASAQFNQAPKSQEKVDLTNQQSASFILPGKASPQISSKPKVDNKPSPDVKPNPKVERIQRMFRTEPTGIWNSEKDDAAWKNFIDQKYIGLFKEPLKKNWTSVAKLLGYTPDLDGMLLFIENVDLEKIKRGTEKMSANKKFISKRAQSLEEVSLTPEQHQQLMNRWEQWFNQNMAKLNPAQIPAEEFVKIYHKKWTEFENDAKRKALEELKHPPENLRMMEDRKMKKVKSSSKRMISKRADFYQNESEPKTYGLDPKSIPETTSTQPKTQPQNNNQSFNKPYSPEQTYILLNDAEQMFNLKPGVFYSNPNASTPIGWRFSLNKPEKKAVLEMVRIVDGKEISQETRPGSESLIAIMRNMKDWGPHNPAKPSTPKPSVAKKPSYEKLHQVQKALNVPNFDGWNDATDIAWKKLLDEKYKVNDGNLEGLKSNWRQTAGKVSFTPDLNGMLKFIEQLKANQFSSEQPAALQGSQTQNKPAESDAAQKKEFGEEDIKKVLKSLASGETGFTTPNGGNVLSAARVAAQSTRFIRRLGGLDEAAKKIVESVNMDELKSLNQPMLRFRVFSTLERLGEGFFGRLFTQEAQGRLDRQMRREERKSRRGKK